MESALAVMAYTVASHIVPQLLPVSWIAPYSLAKPAVTWGLTASLLASRWSPLFGLIALPQCAVAVLTFVSGARHPTYWQVLYAPAVASIVSWVLRSSTPYSAVAVVVVSLMHLTSVILGLIVTMLYPAPYVGLMFDVATSRNAIAKDPSLQLIQVPVLGTPSIRLEGVVVRPSVPSPGSYRRFMLYCGGNGELFEGSFQSLAALADRLGVTVVMVNPRGVGSSEGVTLGTSSLVEDARSTVEYLLHSFSHGPTSPRDVVVFGHSIGGGVAGTLVSKYYPDMSLVLDRTFSSLKDAAVSLSPVRGVSPRLVSAVLQLCKFEGMDNDAAFQSLPHDRKLITYHRSDQIIRFMESSIARLPQYSHVDGGVLAKYVVELQGRSTDPHNSGIYEFHGFTEFSNRVKAFYL